MALLWIPGIVGLTAAPKATVGVSVPLYPARVDGAPGLGCKTALVERVDERCVGR